MIVCTNCNSSNMSGSAFCSECGVILLASKPAPGDNHWPEGSSQQPADSGHDVESVLSGRDNWATLQVLESGQLLSLTDRNEFTIGRTSKGQAVMPDVDLSPHRAYSQGVSRLHAVIKREAEIALLADLDSANGTFLNGRRLKKNEEAALTNGDVVTLGGLRIQILLKAP
jgi:hypothetical protein